MLRTEAFPIALALDTDHYDAPQKIRQLCDDDAEVISNNIASVTVAGEDDLLLWQAADSLTEHSHYLWQRAHVLRVNFYTRDGLWDSPEATQLYLGLQCRPLSDLRALCIGLPFSVVVIAAMLLHTPGLEVLDIFPVRGPDDDARYVFDDPVGEELFRQGLPRLRYPFRLRRLAYRGAAAGAGAIFFCQLFDQSRETIEWLFLPLGIATPQVMACLEQGNCVTTLLQPTITPASQPAYAPRLLAMFPRLRRLVVKATDFVKAPQALTVCKASLRHLALGWDNPDERTMFFTLQMIGMKNLLAVLPQLKLRELTFQHPQLSESSTSMPSCPPQLMEGIRAACQQRRTRITHSVHTLLTDDS